MFFNWVDNHQLVINGIFLGAAIFDKTFESDETSTEREPHKCWPFLSYFAPTNTISCKVCFGFLSRGQIVMGILATPTKATPLGNKALLRVY